MLVRLGGPPYDRYYLLDVFRKRLDYPDLERAVLEQARKYHADIVLIEDKASGTQLIQASSPEECMVSNRMTLLLGLTRSCDFMPRQLNLRAVESFCHSQLHGWTITSAS